MGIPFATHGNGNHQDDTVSIVPFDLSPSGTHAFQLTTVDGRIEFDLYPGSLIQDDFYFSFWMYIPSTVVANTSSSQWLVLFQIEGSVGSRYEPIGKLGLNSWTGSRLTLWWEDTTHTQYMLADPGINLPRDQWVHFEWYTHIGTNGELACWMNGQKLWDLIGGDTSALNQSTLYFMPCLYGTNGTVYVDEMSLYNVNISGGTP